MAPLPSRLSNRTRSLKRGSPSMKRLRSGKSKGEQAFEILLKLRARICDILSRYGIAVLPEEEWRRPVPWLRADEEVLVGTTGEPIRVLDALFFEGL